MNALTIGKWDVCHVHTYRCRHAVFGPDEAYIEQAEALGADRIIFTDHAPFPGDPFGNRMLYDELPEYIATMTDLKRKYEGRITVEIGLETEYLPSFRGYYEELKAKGLILIMGQHMVELAPGRYSFSLEGREWAKDEPQEITHAEIEGMRTGYFSTIAHPDFSAFRRQKEWKEPFAALAADVARTAAETGTYLERNVSAMIDDKYRYQFWDIRRSVAGNDAGTYFAPDAHDPAEIIGWRLAVEADEICGQGIFDGEGRPERASGPFRLGEMIFRLAKNPARARMSIDRPAADRAAMKLWPLYEPYADRYPLNSFARIAVCLINDRGITQ